MNDGLAIRKGAYEFLTWLEAALIVLAFGLLIYAARLHLHHRWIYLRSAAEIVSSLLCRGAWLPSLQVNRIWAAFPGFIRVHRGIRRMLFRPAKTDWREARNTYLRERVADQKAYYLREKQEAKLYGLLSKNFHELL